MEEPLSRSKKRSLIRSFKKKLYLHPRVALDIVDMSIVKRGSGFIVMNMSSANLYCRACNGVVVMNMAIIKSCFTIHIVHMARHIGITAGYSGIFMDMTMIYACHTSEVM
jgi:hypothetical protein